MLESAYEQCLSYEPTTRNIPFARRVVAPLIYKTMRIDAGLRMDLLVGQLIVVEVKAVEKLLPVHEAQLLTYLRSADYRVGLLINFNVPLIKDGIRRIIRPK